MNKPLYHMQRTERLGQKQVPDCCLPLWIEAMLASCLTLGFVSARHLRSGPADLETSYRNVHK